MNKTVVFERTLTDANGKNFLLVQLEGDKSYRIVCDSGCGEEFARVRFGATAIEKVWDKINNHICEA